MAYVNLSHMPNPRQEYTLNFTNLNGGLNLSELEYRLRPNESPEMLNMIWRDGVICGRDGQEWVTADDQTDTAYAMFNQRFHGWLFAHIGHDMCNTRPLPDGARLEDEEGHTFFTHSNVVVLPEKRGSFFLYGEDLYYKAEDAYVRISYHSQWVSDHLFEYFQIENVVGYTPVTVINANPSTGSGDLYQPENRIQSKKTVWYNAVANTTVYQLPVKGIDSVTSVEVDGEDKTEGTDYTVNLTNGTVTFSTAPPVTNPPSQNTVHITYSKANQEAYDSVMKCPYATTYGGSGDLCVVVGGCPAQPNAFFWSGHNVAMDPTYFPFPQYQLAGGADDPITGFGKQQSYLVVFKERSIGRAKMDTTELNDRTTIDMPFTAINDKIGCDLPWTIQLIDNNLVWCNTEQGVHILKDSSYAYENNVACVSTKVNGFNNKLSLIRDARKDAVVCSLDDNRKYWLCVDGHAWLWDYENTDYKNPSWYFFDNIEAVAFATEYDTIWHINSAARLTVFARNMRDYDESTPINKVYRFPAQDFGGYDRLKNVNSCIIVMRGDLPSKARLTYITDYETRVDLTDLEHRVWRLVPRDLTFRCLAGTGFGAAFRRRPMCRRVRHYTMRLENREVGSDLSIVSAQVFYNFQGRLR